MNYEVIGIVATIFVLISFLMNTKTKIRAVNIVGSALFVVYGILISSFSTYLLNGTLILIHIYFLTRREEKHEKNGETE